MHNKTATLRQGINGHFTGLINRRSAGIALRWSIVVLVYGYIALGFWSGPDVQQSLGFGPDVCVWPSLFGC